MKNRSLLFVWFILIPAGITGCDATYYAAMEKMGRHKRDILVDRVESARDAQEDAKEQFRSALEKFSSVVQFEGGDLEDKYEQLKIEYDKSDDRAERVRERIAAVENVAEDLFAEWQAELTEYTNPDLRRASERRLKQTRREYKRLIDAMRRAERRIEPVLAAFNDQVLFLKHNLNARAVASLQNELGAVESEVAALIREMEISINEATAFINGLENSQ
jgi:hypothetical protein